MQQENRCRGVPVQNERCGKYVEPGAPLLKTLGRYHTQMLDELTELVSLVLASHRRTNRHEIRLHLLRAIFAYLSLGMSPLFPPE